MRHVKRRVGGQTVELRAGAVYVGGVVLGRPKFDRYHYSDDPRYRFGVEPVEMPDGMLFVLGDNSKESFDSRFWGFVDVRRVIGVPFPRVWPLHRFGPIRP
jgi:signal peptidase I